MVTLSAVPLCDVPYRAIQTKGVLEQELTRARLENAELHARMDELDSSDFDKVRRACLPLFPRFKHASN